MLLKDLKRNKKEVMNYLIMAVRERKRMLNDPNFKKPVTPVFEHDINRSRMLFKCCSMLPKRINEAMKP